MLRRTVFAVAFAAVSLAVPTVGRAAPATPAPAGAGAKPYIVVLKDDTDPNAVANEHARQHAAQVSAVWGTAIHGYAARIPEQRLGAVRSDPRVAYVEPDAPVTASTQTLPWGINRIDADVSSTAAGNGWGAVGTATAYVIDSGISTHGDLYRTNFVNFTGDGRNYDCNGHGTHVAGTIAARDDANYVVGVAPGASLVALKVLDCSGSGSMSWVISAVNWTTSYGHRPAVVNMSLGGPATQSLDDAIRRSASMGVLYMVAAGNDGGNACNYSPARAGAGTNNGIVTVGAVDSYSREPSWSNAGSCVDIWAPGVNVLSTYNNGGTAYMSGTSMATPHVAGAGALYLSRNSTVTPASAEAVLKSNVLSATTYSRDGRAIKVVYAGRY